MLSIPGTGPIPPTSDLTTPGATGQSIIENAYTSGPSLTRIIAVMLILSSLWASTNILIARSDPAQPQVEDKTIPQSGPQHNDQRPMMFVMGFLMLLLPYISILEPDLAHLVVLFLRFTGMGYMGLLAFYLNPEVMVSHYWVVYLFGSSIGSSLLLTQHTGRFELVLLVAFGLCALSMQPLITLNEWLNQPQTKDNPKLHPEEGKTPHQPLNGPPKQEEPSNANSKHSSPKIRGGDGRNAAKAQKYKKTLRWLAVR